MSIDFMVFDPTSAPRDHHDFRSWYHEQTDWPDDYDHDPSITTSGIQSWYRQMTIFLMPMCQASTPEQSTSAMVTTASESIFATSPFGRTLQMRLGRGSSPLPPTTDLAHTIPTTTMNAAATQSASPAVRTGRMSPSTEAYAASSVRGARPAILWRQIVFQLMSAMGRKRTFG